METIYYAWFKDGSSITKESLEEAIKLFYFDYIIKSIPIKKSSKGYIQYKYDFFDKNGNLTKVKVNNFELIDIMESEYNPYDKELTFYDTNRGELFKLKVNGSLEYVFSNWIIGFLNKINDLGSFEVYKIHQENERLKKVIEGLKKKIDEKNSLIEDLENQIENLKQDK
jgi:vacuolar-type H+-ATPase subunit I/STV1